MQLSPRFARVIVDRSADREFDYLIPPTLAGKVQVGSRVRLPFRNRAALGTVVDLPAESPLPEASLRPLTAVIGDKPVISPILIELARWMADYYCCPVETAMRSVLPQVIRDAEITHKTQLFARLVRPPTPDELAAIARKAPPAGGNSRRSLRFFRSPPRRHAHKILRRDPPDHPVARQSRPAGNDRHRGRARPLRKGNVHRRYRANPFRRTGRRPAHGPRRDGRARRRKASRSPLRRHRQRQDGSLPSGHRVGTRTPPDRARACPGNQPHAADRRTLQEPLLPLSAGSRRPPQPPFRRRAP